MAEHKESSNDKSNNRSRIAIAVVFLLLVCVMVLLNIKWDKLSPDNLHNTLVQTAAAKEEFSEKLSGTSVQEKNIINTGTGIYYISDTSILQLDYNGNKNFSGQHSYTSPCIKCSDNYAVAFGLGSDKFRVISPSFTVYNGTQGTSIIDCDINSKGTYCVMSDHTGYLSVISVYDKDNEFIFSYSFNNYYGVSCAINTSGTMAAVGAVNTIDGALMSKVYILRFDSDEPAAVFDYKDSMIYEVKYIDNDKVAVITDTMVSVVDCSSKKEAVYPYGSKFLASYDLDYGDGMVLALSQSDDGRNCKVVFLDENGKEENSFNTEHSVYSIKLNKDKISLLSGDMLYSYNTYGDLLGRWQVGHDAKSVTMINDKTAFILGVSELRKIILE